MFLMETSLGRVDNFVRCLWKRVDVIPVHVALKMASISWIQVDRNGLHADLCRYSTKSYFVVISYIE